MQHRQRRIEREIGAGFDPGAMPALGLVVADDRHVIGEDPAEAGVDEPGRALLLGGLAGRGLDVECQPGVAIDSIERNSHGLSPGLTRIARPRLGAVGYAWPSAPPAWPVPRQPVADDMLLRNAEVQYVCRNAARQSHGSPIRGPNCHRWLFWPP